jgi:ADP-heptose:LPS heptosyltransferase
MNAGELPERPGTPLSNGLLVRNPAWNAWLRIQDAVYSVWPGKGASAKAANAPKKILIGVGGHLGDAVLATSVLALLKDHMPHIEVGVVSGSWNASVLERHPRVRRFHRVDHWKLSRAAKSWGQKWSDARSTRRSALAEIAAVGYAAAVDLTPYYPNFAGIFRAAEIPVRAGFTTGGGGPLHTHPVAWQAGRHVAAEQLALLRAVLPSIPADAALRCELAPLPEVAVARAQSLLASRQAAGSYTVVHPGAGAERKEWPVERWVDVITRLRADVTRVVLTGAGALQARLIARIAAAVPGTVDLCDQLSFDEFRAVIAGSRVLLSVDTVAMHVAAAHNVPSVSVMTAIDEPTRWRPLSARSVVLWERVRCAPCYRSRGCAAMACVRGVRPDAVLEAMASVLTG